jgi:hypothetical protein
VTRRAGDTAQHANNGAIDLVVGTRKACDAQSSDRGAGGIGAADGDQEGGYTDIASEGALAPQASFIRS